MPVIFGRLSADWAFVARTSSAKQMNGLIQSPNVKMVRLSAKAFSRAKEKLLTAENAENPMRSRRTAPQQAHFRREAFLCALCVISAISAVKGFKLCPQFKTLGTYHYPANAIFSFAMIFPRESFPK